MVNIELSPDVGVTGTQTSDTDDTTITYGGLNIKSIKKTVGAFFRRNYRFWANVGKSIVLLSEAIELDGDVLAPGNSYYYGTNSAGVKGFFLIGELSDYKVKPDLGGTAAYLDGIADGVTIEITAGDKLALKALGIVDAYVNAAAAIAWSKISKAGSSLADLVTAAYTDLTGQPADDNMNALGIAAGVVQDGDFVLIYDISASAYKKIARSDLLVGLTTAMITDKAITLAKIEDIGRGFLITGHTDNTPIKTNFKTALAIGIGDGTDYNSVVQDTAGDGAFDIAGKLTITKGTHAVVTGQGSGLVKEKLITGATLKAMLDSTTNDLTTFQIGDIILEAQWGNNSKAGAYAPGETWVDVGVDATIRAAGALATGIFNGLDPETTSYYSSAENLGHFSTQKFIGLKDIIATSAGTWTTTRGAAGNYYYRRTAANAGPHIIGIDITPFLQSSDGTYLKYLNYIYQITTAVLATSHSVALYKVDYVHGASVSAVSVPVTAGIGTGVTANPNAISITPNTLAFNNTTNSKYVLEVTVDDTGGGTSVYDYYGLMMFLVEHIEGGFAGSLMKNGFFKADATGNLTIKSRHDLSASSIDAWIKIKYLSA